MDEEEFRKRNTDCVYFLASPLTCKKGLECEYRHSEMARLNPTDCRYWLDKGCSNLACAFRHPPLEGRTGAEAESADPPYAVTQPVNKKNVPCYYFFNYFFCKNGDRCQFLHGDEVSTHDWIPSKASLGANYVVAPEKKITMVSNSESAPVKALPSISKTTPAVAADSRATPAVAADIQHKPNKDFQQSAHNNVVSYDQDVPAGRLDSLVPEEGFTQSSYRSISDQNSDRHLDSFVEREEWLESSPDFDVHVGEKLQNLGYEGDADYLSGLGGEDDENDVELNGYDYDEEKVEYDNEYLKPGVEYEDEQMIDSYNRLGPISRCSRDGILHRISSRKRNSMQMEYVSNGQREVDLRDLLKKRRSTDDNGRSNFTRRNESSHLIVERKERPRWHPYNESDRVRNGVNQRGRLRQAHINRQPFRENSLQSRNHLLSSQHSSRVPPRERRSTEEESSTFSGPKTLEQIKEEKKKARENSVFSSRVVSESFQSPRPLNELLKDKKRLSSVVSRSDNSS